ncbi:hypothetical protein EDD11_009430 [Mortierella claussenii]|nr:hypothetical protein EDD11_009430 [Mortierella claussenii]
MFVLSWIRSSDAQASNAPAAVDTQASNDGAVSTLASNVVAEANNSLDLETENEPYQDDWVFLPADHTDLMESSVSNLDLLSASMTLYRTSAASTTHPASVRRTRVDDTTCSTGTPDSPTSSSSTTDNNTTAGAIGSHGGGKKSKRQLKQERRRQQALQEQERQPRYDPAVAKMRDHEFKMAKMAKMGLRSGRIMSGSPGLTAGTSTAQAAF